MFVQAHGMAIDRDGNVWVTDAQNKDGKGQQVFKFSPEGKVLMTLGKAGVAGEGPDTFSGPVRRGRRRPTATSSSPTGTAETPTRAS